MKRRFSDIDEDAFVSEEYGEFVRRKLKPGIFLFVLMTVFVCFLLIISHIYVSNAYFFSYIVIALFSTLLFFTNKYIGGMNNVVFSNDFENALFAGAAGTGYDFLLIIKKNQEIVYYNPSCKEYFTYQPHNNRQGIGSLLESVGIDNEDRNEIIRSIQEGISTEIRCTIQSTTNDYNHLIISLKPISRPKGFFVIKASKDLSMISTPKIQTTPLSDSLTVVWDHFLNQSPLSLVTLNNDFVITRYNSAFHNMCDPKTLKGKEIKITNIIGKDDRASVEELLEEVKENNISVSDSIDISIEGKDNKSATLYINTIDNKDEGDNFVLYFIDTTEQKNLEQRVVHSQKMQAVGQLAGGVAHDFNNLLTAMIGFCDLLLIKHQPGDPSFSDVMQIKQNANRAANLVRQLLAFSRKQTLQPDVMDLSEILSELSNLIRRLIGENISLKINHSRDLYKVKVDKGQFEQVIINLAVNARDAMNSKSKKGKGILTINTKNVTINSKNPIDKELISSSDSDNVIDGDYGVIEVIDNGDGMTKEIQKKIFEPFFTTKKMGEGTGLGLATVYGIIEQTGGHIFVTSKKNKGTTFSIYLKKYDSPEENIKEEDKKLTPDLTGTGTILLVEDETAVRIFSKRALENKGYNVLEADSAEEALEIYDSSDDKIDLIITDVVMPGITGPAMIEKMQLKQPDIKVIFISGYGEDAFIKSYGSQREFNFLPKPFTLNQLAKKVKEVIFD